MNSFDLNTTHAKKVTLSSISCDTVVTHDVSEEFTLPDYVPEVRKVLFTRVQVLPENKYIADSQSGSTLDFGGTVTYSVIYTDDEGKLCSTPLSSNYEASCVLKCKPMTFFIDTACDNATTRVNAPRKLTVKARLKSRILGFEDKEITETINQKSSADELYIERLYENVSTVSLSTGALSNIRMSDKFDTGSKKSLRPVMCDAIAYLREVRAINGGVSCHGEAYVKCICEADDELITLSKSLPLREDVEIDGACATDFARANVRCVSLSISSEEKDDESELFFDISCEIEAEAYRNEENTLTKDCYSTKNDILTEYRELELYSLSACHNGSLSFNESVKRKSKDAYEVVEALIDPVYEKCDFKGERATISARLCACIIGKSKAGENGVCEYFSENYDIPFKYEFNLEKPCKSPVTRAGLSASLGSAKYSDDKLHLNIDIYPSVSVFDKDTTRILDNATLKKDVEFKQDCSCVRVFFPKDGDVLWDIAKKYHTTQKKIISDNALESASLKDTKSIII